MSTIPASQFVNVLPSVLAAGGAALDLIGLVLTQNTRVPVGQVVSFPNAAAVQSYFGPSAYESTSCPTYFNGTTVATKQPGALLFAQIPLAGASAYLRGGNAVASLTLAQLQGISGSLTVVMDGTARAAASINLSSATSFSSAASLIQTGLNGSPTTIATSTGSTIAAATFSLTGSISGNTLTVTAVASGTVTVGAAITASPALTAGTVIAGQLSGTAGGVGTYAVNNAQTAASTTISGTYGTLTIGAPVTGTWSVGETVTGGGTLSGTIITGLISGTGGAGTYAVNLTQTVGSAVSFDSVSGAFVVTSGIVGAASTVAFATGTISASLLLTAATGALLSQGAAPVLPGAFMNQVMGITQNWVSFMTAFYPDLGGAISNRLLFSAWASSTNNRYAYVSRDSDATPPTTLPATASLGNAVAAAAYSGTVLNWEPSDQLIDWYTCGAWASIDFSAANGRTDMDWTTQAGLVAGVTDPTSQANLGGSPLVSGSYGNGYNYVGAIGTANQNFVNYHRGFITGPFQWQDSWVNQVWLNNQLQLAAVVYFNSVKSTPYNTAGNAAIEAALAGPINQAVSFGAVRQGITLSPSQISQVNAAAGSNIAPILSTRGWYLFIGVATPTNRQNRIPPVIVFYYCDGQSVQALNISSVLLQ